MDNVEWAALGLMRDMAKQSLAADGPDLTVRQLVILLSVHLSDAPQTVRGLAKELGLKKPAIVRALDVLEAQDLLARDADPKDRRSILIAPTAQGRARLGDFTLKLADGLNARLHEMGAMVPPHGPALEALVAANS